MRRSWLRTQLGGTPVSALALALLVLGCVFVSVAGPRYSLHARTRALQHALAGVAPVDSAVQVSADWGSFASQVSNANPPLLEDSQLSESRQQLGQFLTRTPLPLGPGQWAGLSTNPLIVTAGAAASAQPGGISPELEVLYRDTLTSNVTLVAGSFPPAGSLGSKLRVAVTEATATRFGLHPGSVLKLAVYDTKVPVIVTAIVRPRAPGSAFWNVDAAALAPSYNVPGPTGAAPLLVGRGVRRSRRVHRHADRLRPARHAADLGVPAQPGRPAGRPGARARAFARPCRRGGRAADR